jgi:aspartate ammonia-lyase
MTPVMTHNILESLGLLTGFLPAFTSRCIDGIGAHREHLVSAAGKNPSLATLLTPKIGYLRAAALAEEAMKKRRAVRDLAVEKGILSEEEADALFDLESIAENRYREP